MVIFLFIFLRLFIFSSNIPCGEEEIENCKKCDTGENSEKCLECEDKYFPFLNNALCIPCDHYNYGNVGCGGNCDSSNYKEIRNVLCEPNGCKEGYYQIEGICFPCSVGSDFCKKCSYNPPNNEINSINLTDSKYFVCEECINNKYKVNEYGRCIHCSIPYCISCHFDSNGRDVCDECIYGYYINTWQTCSKCPCPVYITNGTCMICSDNIKDFSKSECWCNESYVETYNGICSKCPENCYSCNYENLNFICYKCKIGYILNSKKECISCGENCAYCTLDQNENPQCIKCLNGSYLNDDHNCLNCP